MSLIESQNNEPQLDQLEAPKLSKDEKVKKELSQLNSCYRWYIIISLFVELCFALTAILCATYFDETEDGVPYVFIFIFSCSEMLASFIIIGFLFCKMPIFSLVITIILLIAKFLFLIVIFFSEAVSKGVPNYVFSIFHIPFIVIIIVYETKKMKIIGKMGNVNNLY